MAPLERRWAYWAARIIIYIIRLREHNSNLLADILRCAFGRLGMFPGHQLKWGLAKTQKLYIEQAA